MKRMKKIWGVMALLLCLVFMGYAETVSTAVGGWGFPFRGSGQLYLIQSETLDYSVTTVASNDTYQMVNIPSNSTVLAVQYTIGGVSTSLTSAVTIDVGDGVDPDGYASNVSVTNALGWQTSQLAYSPTTEVITYDSDGSGTMATSTVVTAVSTTGYTAGKHYQANDTVDAYFDDAPGTAGTLDIAVVLFKSSR